MPSRPGHVHIASSQFKAMIESRAQDNGRARHLAVDTDGWLLALVVTAASVSDKAGAMLLVIRLFDAFDTLKIMRADRGYDGKPLAAWITTIAAITLEVVKRTAPHSFHVVRRRWVVERTFGWLMRYRRLARDYERRTDHYEAMIYWATILIMPKRLARYETGQPRQPDVCGEVAGEVQLGVGGDDDPGPAVGGGRVAELRAGPSQLLLQEPERVLDVETAQERLPGPVHLVCGGGGAGGPQPDRFRVAAAGQVIDLEADEGALDDGQLAVVVLPGGAAGELLMQPGPGHRLRGAVPGRLRGGDDRRLRPGRRLAEAEPGPVPERPAVRPGHARRDREIYDAVGAQPARDVHGQTVQQLGQPGQVVAGIEHDDDVRVALMPVPGGGEPPHHVADLGGGDLGGVIGRAEPDCVQRQRPRRAPRLQRHDPGVRPARNHLRVPPAPRVTVAEQPLRAGLRVGPQPVRDVAGQPDQAVIPPAQRNRRQCHAQPADPDLPAVQGIVDASVPAAALWLQAQLRQHVHPLRPARQRIGHLGQRIAAHAQRGL